MGLGKTALGIGTGLALLVSEMLTPYAQAAAYTPPDVSKATKVDQGYADLITEIPGKETFVEIYKTSTGSIFNKLYIGDKTYGYYVDHDGKLPMEEMLLDTNGDGTLDFKTEAKGSGETPKWILEYHSKNI